MRRVDLSDPTRVHLDRNIDATELDQAIQHGANWHGNAARNIEDAASVATRDQEAIGRYHVTHVSEVALRCEVSNAEPWLP